jgi:hypothetical protein
MEACHQHGPLAGFDSDCQESMFVSRRFFAMQLAVLPAL